jgi:hypothetical protein
MYDYDYHDNVFTNHHDSHKRRFKLFVFVSLLQDYLCLSVRVGNSLLVKDVGEMATTAVLTVGHAGHEDTSTALIHY